MEETSGYAVFFFPQALEALGDAIKPYLLEGQGGTHVLCREIDTGGAFIEMTLDGLAADGKAVELELMVPGNMVRMIVSARSDESFGFGPRVALIAGTSAVPVGPIESATAATSKTPPAVGASEETAPDATPKDATPKV